jgi:hypothetical protein
MLRFGRSRAYAYKEVLYLYFLPSGRAPLSKLAPAGLLPSVLNIKVVNYTQIAVGWCFASHENLR